MSWHNGKTVLLRRTVRPVESAEPIRLVVVDYDVETSENPYGDEEENDYTFDSVIEHGIPCPHFLTFETNELGYPTFILIGYINQWYFSDEECLKITDFVLDYSRKFVKEFFVDPVPRNFDHWFSLPTE